MPFVAASHEHRKYHSHLQPADYVFLLYALTVIGGVVFRRAVIPGWWVYVSLHAFVVLSVILTVRFCGASTSGLRKRWRNWDLVVHLPLLSGMMLLLFPVVIGESLLPRVPATELEARARILLLPLVGALQPFWGFLSVAVYGLPLAVFLPLYRPRSLSSFEEAKLILTLVTLTGCFSLALFPPPARVSQEAGLVSILVRSFREVVGAGPRHPTLPTAVMAAVTALFLTWRNRAWKSGAVVIPVALVYLVGTVAMREHLLYHILAAGGLALLMCGVGALWYQMHDERKVR